MTRSHEQGIASTTRTRCNPDGGAPRGRCSIAPFTLPGGVGLLALMAASPSALAGAEVTGVGGAVDTPTATTRSDDSPSEIDAALAWLAKHQDEDGKWDVDGFAEHDPEDDRCAGIGDPTHDVGVTGLALLAFLGAGNTMTAGPHHEVVLRAAKWLRHQQDGETGLIGDPVGHTFLYNHAIATLALSELHVLDPSPLLRSNVERAAQYAMRARNPYGAWRYDVPPVGDNDTSVTGWMVMALCSAKEAGIKTDSDAFEGALNWIDEVTDPETGRCGYNEVGSPSSGVPGVNDHFPLMGGEAMTGIALSVRSLLGQDPQRTKVMGLHADLLAKTLPTLDLGERNDMYAWFHATRALYQMGGERWTAWNAALRPIVEDSQRITGSAAGSWDPFGPWGYAGGRVYSTALMTLTLQVSYRYERLIGTR